MIETHDDLKIYLEEIATSTKAISTDPLIVKFHNDHNCFTIDEYGQAVIYDECEYPRTQKVQIDGTRYSEKKYDLFVDLCWYIDTNEFFNFTEAELGAQLREYKDLMKACPWVYMGKKQFIGDGGKVIAELIPRYGNDAMFVLHTEDKDLEFSLENIDKPETIRSIIEEINK